MKQITFIVTIFLLFQLHTFSQTDIDGNWKGAIDIMGTGLDIFVKFTSDEGKLSATIDIPQQGAHNLSLTNVSYQNGSVHFELSAGGAPAIFDGTRKGDEITGIFTQAGIRGSFYLNRMEIEEQIIDEKPVPYNEEDVYINNGDIKLGCTLTYPFAGAPHPAVILITGSGAQDRDENIFGFKPFRILTDHLTPNGIAVLRCDDRGVGESTGNVGTSTSKDLAGDVNAMFRYLRDRKEIRSNQIGLCGHSEGGIIAAMVAAENKDIAFVISMAGTAIRGLEILKAQTELIFDQMGMSEDIKRTQLHLLDVAHEAAQTGEGWDDVETFVRKAVVTQFDAMTDEQREAVQDADLHIDQQVKAGMAAIQSDWYRYFIVHDPSADWRRVTQPVLGIFGELDLQVPPEMNKKALQEALDYAGNPDYELMIIPQANHLFQKAKTGSPTEYATLEKEFIDGFPYIILNWIRERVK